MSGPAQSSKRFLVYGRVQGVGYRFFAQRVATELGIKGAVRNCPDGSVEVSAVGDVKSLARLKTELEAGPVGARVDRVEEHPASLRKYKTFSIEA